MWVARVAGGTAFGDLAPAILAAFEAIPSLLESRDPRVAARLFPETCAEPQDEREWRAHALPELERLFASRSQLVRRDLATMRGAGATAKDGLVLVVPDAHRNAWLSALNAARLALYLLHELQPAWMEGKHLAGASREQRAALKRIQFLAVVQEILLDGPSLSKSSEKRV